MRLRRARVELLLGLLLAFLAGMLALWFAQRLSGGSSTPPVPVALAPLDASPDVTIQFSAGLLAAIIEQSIRAGNAPVRLEHVRVGVQHGLMEVTGDVPLFLRSVSAQITMQPFVETGRLHMRVESARLGPVPVPGDLPRLAEGPIDNQIDAAMGGLPATVTSVAAESQTLTVTARINLTGAATPAAR